MIKFQDMSKEQKQKVALGAIVVIATLFACKQFVIAPMLENRAKSREEFETLKAKLVQASVVIRNEAETKRRFNESRASLTQAHRDHIPSADNSLAWATRTIYSQARSLGLDIESVSETDVDVSGFIAKEQTKRSFKPYAVRISTACGYAQLAEFVRALEEKNPYLCITSIQINGQPNSPERHMVSIVVEWPTWKEVEKARSFLEAANDAT